MEKVSIIVPIYNTLKEYLDECIKSLINQTYNNIEIILVDDGSQKETADICDSYKSLDDRIIVIHKENEGVSIARNTGLRSATGDWILFVDSDDWLEIDAVENLIKHKSNCDVIYSSAYMKTDDGKSDIIDSKFDGNVSEENFDRYILGLLLKKFSAALWAKLYSKKFLLDNEIFLSPSLSIGEDLVFNIKVLSKAKKITITKDIIYNYRVNSLSVMQSYNPNVKNKIYNLLDEFEKDSLLKSIKEKYTDEFYWFVIWHLNFALLRSVFNTKNTMKLKEKNKLLKEIINEKVYSVAINKVKLNTLTFRRRILVMLLRMKAFSLVHILYIK